VPIPFFSSWILDAAIRHIPGPKVHDSCGCQMCFDRVNAEQLMYVAEKVFHVEASYYTGKKFSLMYYIVKSCFEDHV